MSDADVRGKITVDGDTSGLARAMEAGKRTVESFSEGFKAGFEKVNAGIEKAEVLLGKLETAMSFAKFAADMRQMEVAAHLSSAAMDRLAASADGTMSKIQLLQFASKAQNSELQLTEAGMNTVLKAASNLADKGFGTAARNAELLTNVLNTGSVKSLRELGVQIGTTGQKHADYNTILEKYRSLAADSAPQDSLAHHFETTETRIANATASLKEFVGTIILSVLPALEHMIDSLKEIALGAGLVKTDWQTAENARRERYLEANPAMRRVLDAGHQQRVSSSWSWLAAGAGADPTGALNAHIDELNKASDEEIWSKIRSDPATRPGWLAVQGQDTVLKQGQWLAAQAQALASRYGALTTGRPGGADGGGAGAGSGGRTQQEGGFFTDLSGGINDLMSRGGIAIDELGYQAADRFRSSATGGGVSFADTMGFGGAFKASQGATTFKQKEDDFSKGLKDRATALGGAFGALTDGVGAAVNAAITGSESMSKAFFKSSAAALKALAIESSVRALYNTGMAIYSAVIGSPDAAGYALAALKFGAAAAAGGLGSALLGNLGGGSSNYGRGGAAGGGYTRSSSSGGSDGATNITININGQMGDPKGLGKYADEAIRAARRAGKNTGDGVVVYG